MKIVNKILLVLAAVLSYASTLCAQGGYLFAYTGSGENKYKLFYALSPDGVRWTEMGSSPLPEYFGYPSLTSDDSGNFYLLGTTSGKHPHSPVVWKSADLLNWESQVIDASVMAVPPHYENDTNSYGAMKLFFDPASRQFMITWHASLKCYPKGEWHWKSMRTFYILTRDFKTFTKAERLLDFDGPDRTMAQLDATVHYVDGMYYVLVKDERKYDWLSTEVVEDRVPRIARSRKLTGPYTGLSNGLTPQYRNAPIMVRSLDGGRFMLYVVNPQTGLYELYISENIERQGPWEPMEMTPPENCSNGCILPVDKDIYDRMKSIF